MPQKKKKGVQSPSPLGEYITRARELQGMSRKDLHLKTGIAYTTLRNIELEPVAVKTSEENLRKIADVVERVDFDEMRILAGYFVDASETKEVQDQRIMTLLNINPNLKRSLTRILERGDQMEIDRAAHLLEVHYQVERRRSPSD